MRKNGFTLIELLAVITILSVILMIVVVSVSSIITSSKSSLQKIQYDQILKAAEYYNNKEGLKDDDICVNVSYLTENGYLKEDEIKNPKNGKKIEGSVKIKYNGKKYTYEYIDKDCPICKAVDGVVSTELGTKYSCEVKDNTNYTFYVLSEEADKVNLIMNSNICNDGTIPTSDKPCTYAWHWQTVEYDENDNNYGPDTAMANLHQATKSWTNVPDMIMAYEDENNNGTDYGYTSITTNGTTKVTTITGKQNKTSMSQIFGNLVEPLKARLPRQNEVFKEQDSNYCNNDSASCPTWLVENLTDAGYSKYSTVPKTENTYGYWLLSSYSGGSSSARSVIYFGNVSGLSTSIASFYGLRPVITVSKSDLS